MKSWLSVPSLFGLKTSLIWKNFCLMGPRRLRPGWISASGFSVSTVVEIMAINQPLEATWGQIIEYFEHYVVQIFTNLVCGGNHGNINVRFSSNLFLWYDNLSWQSILKINQLKPGMLWNKPVNNQGIISIVSRISENDIVFAWITFVMVCNDWVLLLLFPILLWYWEAFFKFIFRCDSISRSKPWLLNV